EEHLRLDRNVRGDRSHQRCANNETCATRRLSDVTTADGRRVDSGGNAKSARWKRVRSALRVKRQAGSSGDDGAQHVLGTHDSRDEVQGMAAGIEYKRRYWRASDRRACHPKSPRRVILV